MNLVIMLGCAVVPIVVSVTFAGLYSTLWAEAQAMKDDWEATNGTGFNPYESCSVVYTTTSEETGWTAIIIANTFIYLLHIVFTLCLLLTFVWAKLGCCGIFGHFVLAIANLFVILFTGFERYGDAGKACADNSS